MAIPIFQIIGVLLLSAIHASTPNHWLPLVRLGKTDKWSRLQTLQMTALTGLAHSSSAILLGLVIGWLGNDLHSHNAAIMKITSSLILIMLGLFYCALAVGKRRQRVARQSRFMSTTLETSRFSALLEEMFFSPCLAIVGYYFMAGSNGWLGIMIVSVIYITVTVTGMMVLVLWGQEGTEKIRLHALGQHEQAITGGFLLFLGILAYIEL